MATEITTCYRHPDRNAGVRCQRCGRWICPDCMVQASVGFHCPDCARVGGQQVRAGRQAFGAGVGGRPVVTQTLIALNVAVFLIDMVTAGSSGMQGGLLARAGLGELADQGALVGVGVGVNAFGQTVVFPAGVSDGEWWRLFTGGFLHAGLLHIGMNMLFLWILGPLLERELGRLNFALLYVVSLLAGSLGVMLLDPDAVTVGASGAIYGLLGGAVVLQLSRGVNPWSSGIGVLILINVFITFTIPGISIGGHLGGLAGGFIAGWVLVTLDERLRQPVVAQVCAAGLGVAFFALSLWAADFALSSGQPVLNI